MNLTIDYCIKQLNRLNDFAIDVPQNNKVSEGINLVNECIRSGVQDRVQALTELVNDAECVRNGEDAVFYCLEEVNTFIRVLSEFANDFGDDDFGKSVKHTVRGFISKLNLIKGQLDRIAAEEKFSN